MSCSKEKNNAIRRCSCPNQANKICKKCHNIWTRRNMKLPCCRRPPPRERLRPSPLLHGSWIRRSTPSPSSSSPSSTAGNSNRGRRSGAPSPPWSNNNMPSRHTGGLIRKTGPHRLLKDEIVLSRAQRKGFTHGQIVKILKSYKK